MSGDQPDGVGDDYVVAPMSWQDIEDRAWELRKHFGLDNPEFANFPIVDFVEKILGDGALVGGDLILEVRTKQEMGDVHGFTDPTEGVLHIALREDVYNAAVAGNGQARFTLAHELGHLFLHNGQPFALHRAPTKSQNVVAFRRAEPQANQFAAALLMPQALILPTDTAESLVEKFGVSFAAARNRLNYIRKQIGEVRLMSNPP